MMKHTISQIPDEIAASDAHGLADWHHTTPTKFINASGTKYAYRSFGAKTGIPLILLQHFTGTMDDWDPAVTNGLARDFQVVLFDNKGIGATEGQTPDNIEAMAGDTVAFIKAMGFKKVNLLGFSMGGFIAQQVAFDEPALINRLILVGTGPRGGDGIADIVKPLGISAPMEPIEQKLYLFFEPSVSSRALGQESQARINRRELDRDPLTILSAIEAQLAAIIRWAKSDSKIPDMADAIKQPVLIINGNHDIVVPTVNSYHMFHAFSNARLILFPDSGHGSIFQFPGLFLEAAIPFLNNN